ATLVAPVVKPAAPVVAAAKPVQISFPFDGIRPLPETTLAAAVVELLAATARSGASDLHLSTGARPFIRRHREISYLSDYILTAEDAQRLNTALLSAEQKQLFLETRDLDFALAPGGTTERYRVNLMFHKDGIAGAYRMITSHVPSLDELGFSAHGETLRKLLS